MFFLLRMAFWLTVILAVLPVFVTHDNAPGTASSASKFSAGDALGAATATMSDLGQFCTRRPEACEVGLQAAAAIGASAQNGVKILYEFLQEKAADAGPALSREITPSANTAQARPAAAKARDVHSQNTLSSSDLDPAWRGGNASRNTGA